MVLQHPRQLSGIAMMTSILRKVTFAGCAALLFSHCYTIGDHLICCISFGCVVLRILEIDLRRWRLRVGLDIIQAFVVQTR